MTYRTAIFPALACALAFATGPAGAGTATGTERLSSDEIGELKELLVAHGISPARRLAGEITRDITESNREAATAALFRPPALHSPGAAPAPARAAVAQAREAGPAKPPRAGAPLENRSPLRNALRKIFGFLRLSN